MKNLLLLLLFIFVGSSTLFAQDIEVKKFGPLEKDQTSTLNPKKDINGIVCGLVKVQIKVSGVSFTGNVVGDVEENGMGYNVYLANGSKRINIKHPDFLPKTIVFSDYGVSKIESGKTYILDMKLEKIKNKGNTNKQGVLVLCVKPTDAELYVDDKLILKDNSGIYTLNLSQGSHYYSVKQGNLSINNMVAKVGNKANKIYIDLTKYYAYVNVNCEQKDAEIYINNNLKGKGEWKGILPPGEVVLTAKRIGCSSLSQTIFLNENDSVNVNFTDFKMLSGSLSVNYKPDGCDVYIDGNKVGVTPCYIGMLSVGEHSLKLEKPYYSVHTQDLTIEEEQEMIVSGSLSFQNAFSEIWIKAQEGDKESQFKVACCYLDDSYTCYMDGWDRKNRNPSKAIPWLERSAKQNYFPALMRLGHCLWNGLGCQVDSKRAFEIFVKCADMEPDENVYYWLGTFYRYGYNVVDIDLQKAVSWYRKALLVHPNSSIVEKAIKEIENETKVP